MSTLTALAPSRQRKIVLNQKRTYLLQPHIEEEADIFQDRYDVYQLSVSGLSAKYGDLRYNENKIREIFRIELKAPPPDLILVWIGMNDCKTIVRDGKVDTSPTIVDSICANFLNQLQLVFAVDNPDVSVLWVGPGTPRRQFRSDGTPENPYEVGRHFRLVERVRKAAARKAKIPFGNLGKSKNRVYFRAMHAIGKDFIKDKFNHIKRTNSGFIAWSFKTILNDFFEQ